MPAWRPTSRYLSQKVRPVKEKLGYTFTFTDYLQSFKITTIITLAIVLLKTWLIIDRGCLPLRKAEDWTTAYGDSMTTQQPSQLAAVAAPKIITDLSRVGF